MSNTHNVSQDYIWSSLKEKAYKLSKSALNPSRNLNTGAAAQSSKNITVVGVSYNHPLPALSLCSESSLVTNLISNGGGLIEKLVIVDQEGNLTKPCKRCMHILSEHVDPNAEILLDSGLSKIKDLY